MPEPLSAEAFAPFGGVLTAPAAPGRTYFDEGLCSLRKGARPSLSLVRNEPVRADRLMFSSLECHRYSSQSFVPMEAKRWLVVVATERDGRPDMTVARAFVAGPAQGITYFAGTWHLGLHVLDEAATHAIFMWRDHTIDDETFVTVEPTIVQLQDFPEV